MHLIYRLLSSRGTICLLGTCQSSQFSTNSTAGIKKRKRISLNLIKIVAFCCNLNMKFCKNLQRVVDISDPEWAPYWTNYKMLKVRWFATARCCPLYPSLRISCFLWLQSREHALTGSVILFWISLKNSRIWWLISLWPFLNLCFFIFHCAEADKGATFDGSIRRREKSIIAYWVSRF